MAERLDAFARRLRDDPYFLAAALEDFAQSEGLDGEGLARTLGCKREQLGLLGLCRRPRTDPAGFEQDVQRISHRFEVDAERLAEVVRRSEVLAALRQGEDAALLAAARDRTTADRESKNGDER